MHSILATVVRTSLLFFSCVGSIGSISFFILVQPLIAAQENKPFDELRLTSSCESAPENAPIMVQASVEDGDGLFLVDTGASISLLDTDGARNRDDLLNLLTEKGNLTVRLLAHKQLTIGSSAITLSPVGECDLNSLSRVLGSKVSGILGVQLVRELGLGFNGSGKYYHFGVTSVRSFDREYPIREANDLLWTNEIGIGNDQLDECLIDTGFSGAISVTPERFDELATEGFIELVGARLSQTLTATKSSRRAMAKHVFAFGQRFDNVPIAESRLNKVGLGLLSRFSFFINVREQCIRITDGIDNQRPFLLDMSGLSLICDQERVVVFFVRDDSPAAIAGLNKGDEIVAVDTKPVEANWKSLHELRALLANPLSFPVELEIRSTVGKKKFELKLTH